MEKGTEKFAKTEPFPDSNDVAQLGKQAGLDLSGEEKLGLKDKLEQRDRERLNLENQDTI